MFKLKRPCKTCPFRRDTGHCFAFSRKRLEGIAAQDAFQCHNTVDYDAMEEGRDHAGDNPQQCAGLMALLHREGRPNTIMQVASRLGYLDLGALEPAQVYRSLEEAVESHATMRPPA